MKNNFFLSNLYFILCLFSSLIMYSQDLLNPVDAEGKSWFNTQADKNNFLTKLFLNAKDSNTATGLPTSIIKDVFIVLIKKDTDTIKNNSNETYVNLIVSKMGSISDTDSYTTTNSSDTPRSPVYINYLLGSNMEYAKFSINQFIPSGWWGTSLVSDSYTTILTAPGINSSTNSWIPLNQGLQLVLKQINTYGL